MIAPELARAAAEWWGDRLLGRQSGWDRFREAGYFTHGGQDARNGLLGGGLVDMILEKSPAPTEEAVGVYVGRLADRIVEEGKDVDGRYGMTVSTDYHPCRILSEPAEGLGFENLDLRFPWKTCMHVAEDYLEVARDILWQTKRDALRRRVEEKIKDWEDSARTPPRYAVFGDSGPGKWDRVNDGLGEDAEQLYWTDSRVIHKRFTSISGMLPPHPYGDLEALASAILADLVRAAPSVLGVVAGGKYAGREIVHVGNLFPKKDLALANPEWQHFYGEVVVSKNLSTGEMACLEAERFVAWLLATETEIER